MPRIFGIRALQWTALALLLSVLLLAAVLYAASAVLALQTPDLLEVGEPWLVSAAWQPLEGGSIYNPVNAPPFLHHNYTPLGAVMQWPLLLLTGPSFLPGRVLTIGATCLLALMIAMFVRRQGGSRSAAVVAATLLFTTSLQHPWMLVGRVDMLALLFSFAAFLVGTNERRGFGSAVLFLCLALAAWATKQTAVAGPLAALLCLFWRGARTRALVLSLLWIATVLGLAALLTWSTNGQFWKHVVGFNARHTRDGFGGDGLSTVQLLQAPGIALLALLLLPLLLRRTSAGGVWWLYAASAGAVAALGLSKSGSHVHHLLEVCTVLSVVAALGFDVALLRLRAPDAQFVAPQRSSVLRGWTFVAVLLLAAVGGLWGLQQGSWQKLKHLHWLSTRTDLVPAEVRAVLRDTPRPVLLCSKLGSLAVEAGRAPWLDMADFRRLEVLGVFQPDRDLVPLLEHKRFGLIGMPDFAPGDAAAELFDPRRFAGFEAALYEHYLPMLDEATGARLRLDDPKSRRSGTFWRPKS
ncbi:MAG: hypothetical protein EXS14_02450 [Planctomycetes bacterium]|nr:hypothetical protein [Planctomycetota bacterium]